jgi:hypothetical protein
VRDEGNMAIAAQRRRDCDVVAAALQTAKARRVSRGSGGSVTE